MASRPASQQDQSAASAGEGADVKRYKGRRHQQQQQQQQLQLQLPHTREEEAQRRVSATLDLLKALRPCTRCRSYARYGAEHDGGYIMCQDALEGVTAAYSFGIGSDDRWGKDVTQHLGVPVFEFDCFHTTGPSCNNAEKCDLHFRSECLGLPPSENETRMYRTLEEHLDRNPPPGDDPLHLTKGGNLLLKVDVEGKEWNTFADVQGLQLKRMRQIVVEFHLLSRVDVHEFYLTALRNILKAGFVVAHVHGNNFGSMALFADGRYQVPDVVEVTFVNKLALPLGSVIDCANKQDLLALDAPNNVWELNLPTANLPTDDADISVRSEQIPTTPVVRCRYFCWLLAPVMAVGPLLCARLLLLIVLFGFLFRTMLSSASQTPEAPPGKTADDIRKICKSDACEPNISRS